MEDQPVVAKNRSPRSSSKVPAMLGRYQIEAEIGQGTMGVVHKGIDPVLRRAVALKVIRLQPPLFDDDRACLEQRFLREASLAAGLNHPNIVVVYDVARDPATGTPFMALEYLEGRTLAQVGKSGMRLDWRESLRIVARLADALHYAHGKGIVHRDIKPSNIMLLANGEPKILDFGIAQDSGPSLTASGESWGTPCYMSPEQAAGDSMDGRSDLFALGAVLYELLTGQRAFDAKGAPQAMLKVLCEDPLPPSQIDPSLSPELDALVAGALAKNVDARYRDGRAFAVAIENILSAHPAADASGSPVGTGPTVLPAGAHDTFPTLTTAVPRRALWFAAAERWLPSAGTALLCLAGALVFMHPLMGATAPASAPVTTEAMVIPIASVAPTDPPATPPPSPSPTRKPVTPVPTPVPARVLLSVEHGLEDGRVAVWVDGKQVAERELAGTESKRLLVFKQHKGSFTHVVEVPPGQHTLRVEVTWDGKTRSAETIVIFGADETRLLEARLGEDVVLSWKS